MSTFAAGTIYVTIGVRESINNETHRVIPLIRRHLNQDWGDVCEEDKQSNNQALINGGRLLSSYTLDDETIWIITEADRSATTILLPSEYWAVKGKTQGQNTAKNRCFYPKLRLSDQKPTREVTACKNHRIARLNDSMVGKASKPMVGRSDGWVPSIINPTYLFLGTNAQQLTNPTVRGLQKPPLTKYPSHHPI